MGCCAEPVKEKGVNHIVTKRGCTDILMLLAFVASWGALFVFLQMALELGANPEKILRGHDTQGNICGGTFSSSKGSFAAWPDPTQYTYMTCVKECNYTMRCDSDQMTWRYPTTPFMNAYCMPDLETMQALVDKAGATLEEDEGAMGSAWDQIMNAMLTAVADLNTAQWVMAAAAGGSIFVSFFMIAVLRQFAGVIVATALTMLVASILVMGYGVWTFADYLKTLGTYTAEEISYVQYVAYGIWGIAAILCLVILFLRKQILIAIAVIKESAGATADMRLLIFFPLWPAIFAVGYFLAWIWIALNIASVSTLTQGAGLPITMLKYSYGFGPEGILIPDLTQPAISMGTCWTYQSIGGVQVPELPLFGTANKINATNMVLTLDETWQYIGLAHFFHLLWVTQFLFYFAYLVFAGATADWYFTARDENGNKKRGNSADIDKDGLSYFPIIEAVGRTLRYHVGTVAVTAFIIATIQFIRAVVLYVEKTTSSQPPNKIQKAVFCLIHCCLRCVECCMDKINKNALIWTAIYGDNFCKSACSSFELIWRNLARVAAINMVSGAVLALCKVSIAVMTATGALMYMRNDANLVEAMSSPILPTVLIFFCAYVVAMMFMAVFHAIIDTVFLCFLVDAENNDAGQMMASVELQKLVGKYQGASGDAAKKAQMLRDRRQGPATNMAGGNGTQIQVQPKNTE